MSDRRVVQAKNSFAIRANGAPFVVGGGDLYYNDDPIVVAFPQNFGELKVKSSEPLRPASPGSVETASAEPGGRRRLSKPAKVDLDRTSEPSEV